MNGQIGIDELFERRIEYPDPDAHERLGRLVGIDGQKRRLSKILGLIINPKGLEDWANVHHGGSVEALRWVLRRTTLVILAGDVGSGKTELAETICDVVAREHQIDVTLFPISLSTRGQGRVGEMTQLLSAAFEHTANAAAKFKRAHGQPAGAVVLLVDEADALAQSREAAQMHHEDRAGVNAFIRGVDPLASANSPTAIIMCTNRVSSLDPAVKRRAADILTFGRPDDGQRSALLVSALKELGLTDTQIRSLVEATGPQGGRKYGFTYSDLTQRLLPTIILDAYPDGPVDPKRAIQLAREMDPTPPFVEGTK